MDYLLLEISFGTILAGGFVVAYVRRVKKKMRERILRDVTRGLG